MKSLYSDIVVKINELLAVSKPDIIGNKDFVMKFDAKMKKQDELMDELKVMAKANKTLLGRTMQFPMADSYALYVISKVNKTTVEVSWLNWCDGWQDDRLGEKGSLPLSYAEQSVYGRDRIEEYFKEKTLAV